MYTKQQRPKREPVLIALYGDGYVRAFGEKHIDAKIFRVPYCPGSEIIAEDAFELMLPHRYRQLFLPNQERAAEMHRPLLPSTARDAHGVKTLIQGLNALPVMEGVTCPM